MTFLRNSIQNRTILILVIISIFLFRYDFTYNLLPYKVNTNDSLWNILQTKVYHKTSITRLSIEYLTESYPYMNFNKVLANKNDEGGTTIGIFLNKMTIIGPNNKPIVSAAPVLSPSLLISHAIQVIVHNMIVISIIYYIYI